MANNIILRLDQLIDGDRSAFRDDASAQSFLATAAERLANLLDARGGRFSILLYKERELGVTVSPEVAHELFAKQLEQSLHKQLSTKPSSIDEIQKRLEEL